MATVILVAVDRAEVQAGTKAGTSHLVPVVFLGEQLRGGSLRWHLRQQTRCRWTLHIVILSRAIHQLCAHKNQMLLVS